jgi:LysM repeat protein
MTPTPAPALRKKYTDLTKIANDLGIINFDIVEDGDKLRLTGTASYQLAKDELWNAIKRHGGWQDDVVADIKVANTDLHGQYTVKGGDSLSKIARYIYGDASAFQQIFDANRDILKTTISSTISAARIARAIFTALYGCLPAMRPVWPLTSTWNVREP